MRGNKTIVRNTGKAAIKREVPPKQVFLASRKKELKKFKNEHTAEFKTKAVLETFQFGRTVVRKKYDIPETTLRNWISRYLKEKDNETRGIPTEKKKTGSHDKAHKNTRSNT
ncbi:hypothetical protein CMI37_13315 [Candidatus Pacearchaeota archaeon]|nr:hypothetical protein [Candidatus Pacearchaeota archaeon]|tara:strand:- start:4616 stop:4951 length:336 start_codon:yes stop_codon:yes gene_type:complete